MNKKIQFMTKAALIAALYAGLTLSFAAFGYGVMQFRIAEALTVTAILGPSAVVGLTVGCIVANSWSPNPMMIFDIIFGSSATLIAAILSYKFRNKDYLVPLPPVILNGIIIGTYLHFVLNIPLWVCISSVAAGEAVVCYVLGYPLIKAIKKLKLDRWG